MLFNLKLILTTFIMKIIEAEKKYIYLNWHGKKMKHVIKMLVYMSTDNIKAQRLGCNYWGIWSHIIAFITAQTVA